MRVVVVKEPARPWWRRPTALFPAILILGLLLVSCLRSGRPSQAPGAPPTRSIPMTVTAYSSDGKSTGWHRDASGTPVYSYGPNKGKPKAVGITADGTRATRGTIAADTTHYPFGTRMFVPGYGWGEVHDRGSAIKGPRRIDVFFPTREQALQWGRQKLTVQVVRTND